MRKTVALIALAIAPVAHADTLAPDAVICLSEGSMDQLIQAAARRDTRGIRHQFEKKACLRIDDEPEVSVLKQARNDKAYVRIYDMDMRAWTLINYVE